MLCALMLGSTRRALAREYGDSAIYQGCHIKLDLGNTAYTLLKSKGKTQQYEMLFSVNLLKRFYPTIELGYGLSADQAAGGSYEGQGAFTRIGLDLNPLKKGRNNDYALLVGLRAGLGVQQFSLSGVTLNDSYWAPEGVVKDFPPTWRADAWGEIVAAAQVKVAGPFFMGWALRIHFLFTEKTGSYQPYYILGYGNPSAGVFGFNYYIGFKI